MSSSATINKKERQPTAFSAMEIHLDELIDLDRFPIHDLTNPNRLELVKRCREELNKSGCSLIPEFFKPSAIINMRDEAYRLMKFAHAADDRVNPYLTADDTSLPEDHPQRFFELRSSSFINSDYLEQQSMLRKIYDSDVVLHFVADCLNQGQIYRWADPLGRNPYGVMEDGNYFPWHFDGNDFTVSILIQAAETGGDFEYCPDLRTPGDDKFDDVKRVLQGDRDRVKVLKLKTGDLQLFKGRYSMHRVTEAKGSVPRIIALPTYVNNPYLVNRPYHSETLYGRSLPIHHERNMDRADNLTD